jgi:hypothetical protein
VITLALLAAAAPNGAGPAPDQCLLAGPSYSLVSASLERSAAAADRWMLRPLPGQGWPFSSDGVELKGAAGGGPGRSLAGSDETNRLRIRIEQGYGSDRPSNVTVVRGASDEQALPVLVGRCVAGGSPAAQAYREEARGGRGPAIGPGTFVSRKLRAAKGCHLVSSGGWVSRFSIDYHEDGRLITIRPADRKIWSEAAVEGRRIGIPLPPTPHPLLKMVFGIAADKPAGDLGIDTLWVYANDSESSARASFFGHVPKETGAKEDMTGICTDFEEPGAAS